MKRIKTRPIWVFGTRKGYYYDDNSKHMFEFVVKNKPDIEAVWVTYEQQIVEKLNKQNLPVAQIGSEHANWMMDNADVVFVSVILMDVDKSRISPKTKIVQLWHGTPMKQNDIGVFKEHYDLVCIAAEEFLTTQRLGDPSRFNFELTGYPRNDCLLSAKTPIFMQESHLSLLQTQTVITFLPTYNEERDPAKTGDTRGKQYDIWQGLNVETFLQFLEDHNCLFVFKLHSLQTAATGEIQTVLESSDRVLMLDPNDPALDVYNYLPHTDILITDYSSVLFDFLLLERPVIFSCFDFENYSATRKLRFEYDSITPGVKTFSWHDTQVALHDIVVNSNDSYRDERKQVKHRFNKYCDSNSCERVYRQAITLMTSN